jgi:hypothetical protein
MNPPTSASRAAQAAPRPLGLATMKLTKFQQECLDALSHFGGSAALGDLAAKVHASPVAIQGAMVNLERAGVVTHFRRTWSLR